MILQESEKDSMRRFMRVESPLVANARSIRNEAEDGKSGAGDEGKNVEKEADPFAGIDIDNLPDDVKATLEKARGGFATLQQETKAAKELATKNEKIAREQQARADRNFEQLRKHNLVNAKGESSVNSEDGDAEKIEALARSFVAKVPKLDMEVARLQATLHIESQKAGKAELFKEIGNGLAPALGTVGSLYAEKLFAEAQLPKNDPQGIMQIPEIAASIQDNLAFSVQHGQTITAEMVSNLRDMAFGKYVASAKPEDRAKLFDMKTESRTQGFSTAGHSGSGGHFATLQRQQSSGNKPTAANPDTQAAVEATLASMKRGFNLKGGK